jgi:protein pelota
MHATLNLSRRRITSESATGSTDSQRIKLNLTIRVKKVVFSAAPQPPPTASISTAVTSMPTAAAPDEGATLHVSGPITVESPHVKLGAYHTLDLEINRDFTLRKEAGGWDSIGLDRIQEATNAVGGAEVGAIVCGDGAFAAAYAVLLTLIGHAGIANICLITQHTTIVRQRIEVPVPRKRKGGGTALGAEKVRAGLLD